MEERFDTFTTLIYKIDQGIRKAKERRMKQLGLKASYAVCFRVLSEYPEGLTLTKLSEEADIDKAAISRRISEMKDRNLVNVDGGKGNHRYRAMITLTSEGQQIAAQLEEMAADAVNQVSTSCTDTEREFVYSFLRSVEEKIQLYDGEATIY